METVTRTVKRRLLGGERHDAIREGTAIWILTTSTPSETGILLILVEQPSVRRAGKGREFIEVDPLCAPCAIRYFTTTRTVLSPY
jgi:hypothetical protein